MKLETWFRMAGIPYVARSLSAPPKSPSRKIPYIERPDGSLLADSSVIIETLTRERGVKLDEGLSPMERALGVMVQRLCEEDLYFLMLYQRWCDEAGWAVTAPAYFDTMPWVVRTLVVPMVRRQLRQAAWGQGVARLSDAHRDQKGIADVRALAELLSDKPFFFTRPSSIDAVAYAFLANLLWTPIRSAVQDDARRQPNLVAFCERMKETYWKDWSPPAAQPTG
jgi:glutathione S-transferase